MRRFLISMSFQAWPWSHRGMSLHWRNFLCIIFAALTMMAPSNCYAQSQAKIYLAIDKSFASKIQLDAMRILLENLGMELRSEHSIVNFRSDWSPVKIWRDLQKSGYTHFVALRVDNNLRLSNIQGEIIAFYEVGAIEEDGLKYLKWIQRPVRIDARGSTIKSGNLPDEPNSITSEIAQRIWRLFPSFFLEYNYNVKCFQTDFLNSGPDKYRTTRIDFALRLWSQLREENPGVLNPVTDLTREQMVRDCDNSSSLSAADFEKVDLLIHGVMSSSKAKKDELVQWNMYIRDLTEARKSTNKGVRSPVGLDPENAVRLAQMQQVYAAESVILLSEICTSPAKSIELPEWVPAIANQLSRAFTLQYFRKLKTDGSVPMCGTAPSAANEVNQ